MNRLFDFFTQRPRIACALALVALIAGALAVAALPVAFFPSVVRPTISVSCTYPGANAREVMSTVAGPLEDQVNGVEGFDHMTSSCSDNGAYSLTVYFQAGYNRDLALMKVQAKVQQALTQLPQEVKNTGVTVGIGQTIDLGYVSLYSARGELTRDEVVDYMFGIVSPALLRVQGVGASSVQDEKIAMRVWLDADRLAALGMNTDEVVAAIRQQNVQASLGTVGGSPTEDPRKRVLSLVSKGRLKTAEEFGAIIVRTRPDGSLVYLRDIARLGLGHESYAHAGLFGDKPACVTHLYQLPGANTLETIAKVKKTLEDLAPRFPGDMKWDMTVDVSRYSGSALRGAGLSLALAAALAFLVPLVVFRSLRLALVPVLAACVPFALVLATLAMGGYFITVLTLYALTAALVFLTGTAFCATAAVRAGRLAETRAPLLAAGACVSGAALVLLLTSGVQGIILHQFAVVFAASGAAAALNALVVVPALARLFGLGKTAAPAAVASAPSSVPSSSGAPFVGFGAVCAMALAAFALSARMPRDLVPNEDLGIVLVDVKTREGTSRPTVEKIVAETYAKICRVCEIEKSCTVFGEGIFSPSGENTAKMYLVLKPWSERRKGESIMEVIKRIRAVVSDEPRAEINLLTQPTIPGIGTVSAVAPLVLSTADNDPVRLSHEAHRLQAILMRSPLADGVTCGYNTSAPHLRIRVDRAKCELMKVPLATLFTTLQHCLGSIYINDINLGIQVNRVTLMCDWKGRADPARMAGLYVRATTGAMVPVSALVDYEEELGPNAIYRYNRYIYCTVDVSQKAGVSLQDTMDEITRIFARELPRDYDTGWTGMAYEETSNPGRTGLMIALAILVVYLVLMIRFESSRQAFLVLAPTVAAVFGAVALLYAVGVPLSLYSRFALVMLVAVNAAFALLASPEASWRRRAFLPLLAAAMALPLVFTSGAGMAGSRSLGVALLGGFLGYAFAGLPITQVFARILPRMK